MFVNKEVDVLSAKAHIAEAFKSCKTLKQEKLHKETPQGILTKNDKQAC
jgi:hypothetical protein